MSKPRVVILLAMLLCLFVFSSPRLSAQENGISPRPEISQVDLKTQLEKGLKARRPYEFKFISRVVYMVSAGKLPLKTVNSTFLWARPKKPVPFPYFERAIRIQAVKLGIKL